MSGIYANFSVNPKRRLGAFGDDWRVGVVSPRALCDRTHRLVMTPFVWPIVVWIGILVERRTANWLASFLPSLSADATITDHFLNDASRDLGASLLAVTPPMLPDFWVIAASIATFYAISNRDRSRDSYGSRMMNHVRLFPSISLWKHDQLAFNVLPCKSFSHPHC